MAYADCFVLPVPKKNMAAYKKMAKLAAKVFTDHGALEYRECVGEDLSPEMPMKCARFEPMAKAKKGETVVFSWIIYKNRKHRDQVNKKIMTDKRLMDACDPKKGMPFDVSRMAYGGFEVLVEA